MYECMYVCMYVCIYLYSVCVYVCMCVRMYMCILCYVCVYVYCVTILCTKHSCVKKPYSTQVSFEEFHYDELTFSLRV